MLINKSLYKFNLYLILEFIVTTQIFFLSLLKQGINFYEVIISTIVLSWQLFTPFIGNRYPLKARLHFLFSSSIGYNDNVHIGLMQ
jgi:hypothetical protein